MREHRRSEVNSSTEWGGRAASYTAYAAPRN